MRKGTSKPIIILFIFIALLGCLMFFITHLSPASQKSSAVSYAHAEPSVAAVQKQWSAILQHAAAPPRGPQNAPYTLAEFGDFQCPQCGLVRPEVEKLVNDAQGKANLYFVDRPFPKLHKWALNAGAASILAADQHKFWPMYDMLYSHQDDLEPGFYGDYAQNIGLNKDAFNAACNQPQYLQRIQQSAQFCDALGVELTPTIMVRDNATGKVTICAGKQDIDKLAASPPWAGK